MPKGAISGVNDSIQPSTPNLAAAYAVQNTPPAMPAVEETLTTRPERCFLYRGEHGTSYVHGAKQQSLDLISHLLRAELFEESGVEVSGIVDEHIDSPEFLYCLVHCAPSILKAGDVELEREQVGVIANCSLDLVWIAPGRDTQCPAASAALAMSTPSPRPAPVISQTCFAVISIPL